MGLVSFCSFMARVSQGPGSSLQVIFWKHFWEERGQNSQRNALGKNLVSAPRFAEAELEEMLLCSTI